MQQDVRKKSTAGIPAGTDQRGNRSYLVPPASLPARTGTEAGPTRMVFEGNIMMMGLSTKCGVHLR